MSTGRWVPRFPAWPAIRLHLGQGSAVLFKKMRIKGKWLAAYRRQSTFQRSQHDAVSPQCGGGQGGYRGFEFFGKDGGGLL